MLLTRIIGTPFVDTCFCKGLVLNIIKAYLYIHKTFKWYYKYLTIKIYLKFKLHDRAVKNQLLPTFTSNKLGTSVKQSIFYALISKQHIFYALSLKQRQKKKHLQTWLKSVEPDTNFNSNTIHAILHSNR